MQLTVKFTDVYDNEEHERTETLDVPAPTDADAADNYSEWADEHVRPHTGDGKATSKKAGYFAEVITCEAMPELEAREFEWGV